MLALARYVNEEVIITAPGGYTIRVVVLEMQQRKGRRWRVSLGFDAPQEVRINRLEVQQGLDAERQPAPAK